MVAIHRMVVETIKNNVLVNIVIIVWFQKNKISACIVGLLFK